MEDFIRAVEVPQTSPMTFSHPVEVCTKLEEARLVHAQSTLPLVAMDMLATQSKIRPESGYMVSIGPHGVRFQCHMHGRLLACSMILGPSIFRMSCPVAIGGHYSGDFVRTIALALSQPGTTGMAFSVSDHGNLVYTTRGSIREAKHHGIGDAAQDVCDLHIGPVLSRTEFQVVDESFMEIDLARCGYQWQHTLSSDEFARAIHAMPTVFDIRVEAGSTRSSSAGPGQNNTPEKRLTFAGAGVDHRIEVKLSDTSGYAPGFGGACVLKQHFDACLPFLRHARSVTLRFASGAPIAVVIYPSILYESSSPPTTDTRVEFYITPYNHHS